MDSIHKQSKQEKSWITKSSAHVHYNSEYPFLYGAKAFTYGNEIYLGKGAEASYLHELGHVIQQQNGEVKPQRFINNVPVNMDAVLEKKADSNRISSFAKQDVKQPVLQFDPGYTKEELLARWTSMKLFIYEPSLTDVISTILTRTTGWEKWHYKSTILYDKITDLLKTARTSVLDTKGKKDELKDSEQRTKFKQKMIYDRLKSASDSELDNIFGRIQYDIALDVPFTTTGKPADGEKYLELKPTSLEDIRFILTKNDKRTVSHFDEAIALLKTCCHEADVKKAVFGCNLNVTTFLIDYDPIRDVMNATQEAVKAFVRRLELTASFIQQVYQERGGGFWIIPTGSDPHEGGKQALFLESKRDGKYTVYKKRSLEPDCALTGQGGILGQFKLTWRRDREMRLPGMEIDTAHSDEEMVTAIGNEPSAAVTREQALDIFYQLGMMDVLTLLMGVGDLHTDNIIITESGPLIIDAEVSFVEYAESYMQSSDGPLKRCLASDRFSLASSVFYIRDDHGTRMSQDAYKDATSPYQHEFFTGREEMITYLRTGNALRQLMNVCRSNIRRIQTVRIVPIATRDLENFLNSFLAEKDSKKRIDYVCNTIYPTLEKGILQGNFIFNRSTFKIMMIENGIQASVELLAAFQQGTLPAIEFNIHNGEITLDSKLIASVSVRTHHSNGFFGLYFDTFIDKAKQILDNL